MRKGDEKTEQQVLEVGENTDHTRAEKNPQLVPEETLSGSADSTAQASQLASLFGGFLKKTIKRKTLNVILSFTGYIKTLNCVNLSLSFLLLAKYHHLI